MTTWIGILISLSSLSVFAGSPQLLDIKAEQRDGVFVSILEFDQPVETDSLVVDFINETVQVDIPGTRFEEGRRFTQVKDPLVQRIFTYQLNPNTVRTRIIYGGVQASTFEDQVAIEVDSNILRIRVGETAEKNRGSIAAQEMGLDSLRLDVDRILRNEVGLEQVSSEEVGDSQVAEAAFEFDPMADESEIPLQMAETREVSTSANPFSRVFAALGVMLVLALFAFVFLRRWTKRGEAGNSETKIQVLTQFHLGPKKSLAIIRVAGESILIGVTDTNINLIKSLALLDEEIPEQVPRSFSRMIKKSREEADLDFVESDIDENPAPVEEKDEFAISGIKDVVSKRLKNLRSL